MVTADRSGLSRRRFLMYLASSPLLASAGCSKQEDIPRGALPKDGKGAVGLIRHPGRALDVFDLQAVARNKLPIAHYDYLATGVDGEATLRANEEAFSEIHLRPAVR
jgi:4-hydroxymandelate oxidase